MVEDRVGAGREWESTVDRDAGGGGDGSDDAGITVLADMGFVSMIVD